MAKDPQPRNVEPLPLTPEEMKAIGEIELGPSRHEQFLNAHYKKLIIAVIIFTLISIACIVYATWRTRQEADGAAAVITAMKATAIGETADSASYDTAVLDRIGTDYTGTHAAATAELMHGMQLISGGQEQQGIEELENFIQTTTQPFLRLRAQAFLAGRYMSGGQTQKAIELWQVISREGNSPYQALAYLSLGDLAQEAGEIEQARTYYTQLQKECPHSSLMSAVELRLILLGIDAPTPVKAADPQQTPDPTLPASDTFKIPEGLNY